MKKIYLLGLVGINWVMPLRPQDSNEIINRLKNHVTALSDTTAAVLCESTLLKKDIVIFEHEWVRLCAEKIVSTKTLVPLRSTFNLFLEQENFLNKDLFLREFTQLLLAVYKNAFDCLARDDLAVYKKRAPSLMAIFTLYVRVLSLPIGDLLNILDFCHAEFNVIIREHNTPSCGNWWQWLKGNWWVPPVILTALLTSAYMKYAFSYNEEPAFC